MIPVFAMRLICGLSSMWCLAPRRQITSGFFRIQMLLVLGLSVLAAVTADQYPVQNGALTDGFQTVFFALSLGLCFLAFAGSMAWTLERRRGGAWFGLLIFLLSLYSVVSPSLDVAITPVSASTPFPALDALTAAGILGASTGAMLLGHWYLTATGMALQPLVNYCRLFGVAVLLRMIAVLMQVFVMEVPGAAGNWTLAVLRWGGLIGPLVMAGLTLRILRYRNTQSATGVLYAATILVFMGEMASSLLAASQVN